MKSSKILCTILIVCTLFSFSFSKENPKQVQHTLSKSTAGNSAVLMNANNVTSWIRSDGFFDWLVSQFWNGEFPKASGIGTIYSEGIVFGGFVSDGLYPQKLRVTGNTYFVGMQSGAIHANRTVDDPNATSSRAFGVRSDMPPTIADHSSQWPDLTTDAATFFQKPLGSVTNDDKTQIATQYFTDWTEWPAIKGAPWYIDSVRVIRNDGAFNPNNIHHIPGIPGATKTIWFVCNDLDSAVTKNFAGSPPIGMEEQMTLWAYATSNPLNNIIFKQVKLIYKGNPGAPANSKIDSMYIVQWADPDNGDAGDDFAGCDSLLNLGYCYNSTPTDAKFSAIGLPPAAVGYTFLQGASYHTGNPLDSAVVNFQWRKGYKYFHSSPLTAFDYFAAYSTVNDPITGDYPGTEEWYNLMRGDLPDPAYPDGIPFYSSSSYATAHNTVTPYVLSGDPVAGTGWIDGIDLPPGDRRLVNVHGPIMLNINDTAEIVAALVDGMGTDNLSSVNVLKHNVAYAKYVFDKSFNLPPSGPMVPKGTADPLNQEIILNWGIDSNTVARIENYKNGMFKFEGYNVYQLSSIDQSISSATRIATYDLIDGVTIIYDKEIDPATGYIVSLPKMFGTDSGIQRLLDVKTDYIISQPLVNTRTYYYAVTAYAYDVSGTSFYSYCESDTLLLSASPHRSPSSDTISHVSYGDTIEVVHNQGISTLKVIPKVFNPDQITGNTYQISFSCMDSTSYSQFTIPNVKWKLRNVTKDSIVYTGTVSTIVNNSSAVIKDGIQWLFPNVPYYVSGLTPEINSVQYMPLSHKNITGVNASLQAFNGGLDIGPNFQGSFLTNSQCLRKIKIVFSSNVVNQQNAYFYLRGGSPNYKYNGIGVFPGKVYDISTGTPRQVNVAIAEQNGSAVQDFTWDPTMYSGDREYLAILSSTYGTTTIDIPGAPSIDYTTNRLNSGTLDIVYELWSVRIDSLIPLFRDGDSLLINANIPPAWTNTSLVPDLYTINTASSANTITSVGENSASHLHQFALQQNYPNPFNPSTTIEYQLPAMSKVTIKIYNILGQEIKTLINAVQDAGPQTIIWNSRNDKGLTVATGVYFYRLDAVPVSSKGNSFGSVRKMILLK